MIAAILVLLPALAAAACVVPPVGRFARWLAAASALLCSALAGYAVLAPAPAAVHVAWIPAIGATLTLEVDAMAGALAATAGLLAAAAALASGRVPDRRAYFAAMLVVLAALDGAVLARDLFVFVTSWEVLLATLAVLALHWGDRRRAASVRRAFGAAVALDALLLVAIVAVAASRGTADLAALAARPLAADAQVLPLFLVLPALAARLGAFPLHRIALPFVDRASAPIAVVAVPALVLPAAAAIVRIALGAFPDAFAAAAPVLVAVAAVGASYLALVAAARDDARTLVDRVLFAQLNVAAVGFASASDGAASAALFAVVAVALSAAPARLAVESLAPFPRVARLRELPGPANETVVLAGMAGALALPGTATFAADVLVLAGAYGGHPLAAAVAALSLVLAAAALLSFVRRAVQGTPGIPRRAPPVRERALVALLLAVVLALGVAPGIVLDRLPADAAHAGASR